MSMSNVIKIDKSRSKKISVRFKSEYEDFDSVNENHLEKLIQENFKKGFESGYEKAFSELEENYKNNLKEKIKDYNNYIRSVDDKVQRYENEFEDLVVETSFKIAEKIVRQKLEKDSNIVEVLSESLKKIIGSNNIIIKLNPTDYKQIQENNSQSSFLDESLSKVKYEVDERIEKGGCIVETEIGNVDARISSQLSELKKYFEKETVN